MPKKKSTYQKIYKKFAKKHQEKRKDLWQNYQKAWEFLTKTKVPTDVLGTATARFAAASALTASLVFTPALSSGPHNPELPSPDKKITKVLPSVSPTPTPAPLKEILPSNDSDLSSDALEKISLWAQEKYQIKVTPTLEEKKLPVYYGWIGAEQHLQRFPGDVASLHDEDKSSGIAPKTGAWGYFASVPSQLTDDLKLKEKYYVAIQTFLLPNWNTDWPALKEWFKYRKVIVVNPENERAVVAVVADAGPAAWTGKQMGGSPEVIDRLGLRWGLRKGKVLMLFVDDPNNDIALGEIQKITK